MFKEKLKNETSIRGNKPYPEIIDYYHNYHQKILTKGGIHG